MTSLAETLRGLRRTRISLASCPRCRRLVFSLKGRSFDPGPAGELGFWLSIGREGIDELAPQKFAGEPLRYPEEVLGGRASLHTCSFLRAVIVAGPVPLPRQEHAL
jgi:hypothetical protein